MQLSLDRLLASLDLVEEQKGLAQNLNNEPPEIIVSTTPAVLVTVDGDAIIQDFEGADLKYVANTPFMILQEPKSKLFYLKGSASWYTAKKLTDEWEPTTDLPKSVAEIAKQVAEDEAKREEESEVEPFPPDSTDSGEPIIPQVILRTQPAELIQTDGDPDFAPVEGTSLLFLSNTESDVIMDIASQQYYILLAGRWYTSKSLTDGEWSFVPPDELPADFPNIPAESDMGNVRQSIAGTQEARDAVLENSVPQTAVVDRSEATVEVSYDGDPKFEKCGEAVVAYAVNTDKAVFLIDKTYYCCEEAVWFVGRSPEGPWEVATKVPAEIQELPPDCPHYNVKYVYIYDSTPEVVYVGYTPGYSYSYVWGGCVVYGTGYWYRPWYRHHYYPRAATWGYGVHWNPYSGWGFSFGLSHGWLHVGIRWGGPFYHRGWWGPRGYRSGYRHGYWRGRHHGYHRGYRQGYNHGRRAGARAGYSAGRRGASSNVYRNRSNGVRNTGASAVSRDRARSGTARTQTHRPQKSNQPNNVYADRNGNVHRNQNGQWQNRDKSKSGGWSQSDRSSSRGSGSSQNLNRQQSSRNHGTQRTRDSRNNSVSRSSGSSRSRSSGGSRGGGGGRRR